MPIVIENLTYTYSKKTPYERKALDNINLTINDGDFLGIVGHTGSGKSTLIQHLNVLIKVQEGKILINGIDITQKKVDLKKIRSEIGMVFQYPENQLFDETVAKDVAFGPKNLGLSKEEIDNRVRNSLESVGLDYDKYANREPFELSGGEKRRVAIAGVLSMSPKILILDEPTAGLDPLGKKEIMNLIKSLQNKSLDTVIVISHDIDEIVEYANRIVVLNDGKIVFDIPPQELFQNETALQEMGLDIPETVKIRNAIVEKGYDLPFIIKKDELINAIKEKISERIK